MKKFKKITLIVVGWILFGALILSVGVENIIQVLGEAHESFLLLGAFIFLCAQIVRGIKWSILFSEHISIVEGIKLYMVNTSYSIFSPLRLADFSAPFLLRENDIDIDFWSGGRMILLDKIIDFFVVLFFVSIGSFFIAGSFVWACLIFIGTIALSVSYYLFKVTLKKIRKSMNILGRRIILVTSLSSLAFVMEIVSGYFLISSVYDISFLMYSFLKPVSILIGILSLVPSGIGIESYSIIHLFSFVGEKSLNLSSGVIFAKILTIFVTVIMGQCILIFSRIIK